MDHVYDFDREARKRFVRERARKWLITGCVVICALILLSQSLFVVGEAEQAVVSRFGVIRKLVLNSGNTFHEDYASLLDGEITTSGKIKIETTSGLHFKMPFVDTVEKWLDTPPRRGIGLGIVGGRSCGKREEKAGISPLRSAA